MPLYQKALNIWEMVIDRQDLEAFRCSQLYGFSGWAYYRLGDYIKAIEYFENILDNNPGYRYITTVQYMVGDSYEKLKKAADVAMSGDEADLRIEAAYLAVVEKWPEKSLADSACYRLGQLYFDKEQWPEVIVYFEMYRPKRPSHYRFLYMLGQAYEKMGDNELAIQVYEDFLTKAREADRRIERVQARLDELKGGQ